MGLGHRETGDLLERIDVLDVAVVDQPLREIADAGVLTHGGAHDKAMFAAEQALIETQSNQPEDIGIHAGEVGMAEQDRQPASDKPSAKGGCPGVFGDEALSLLVLDRIKAEL